MATGNSWKTWNRPAAGFKESGAKVGDEVIVCDKLVNYTDKSGNVTPEFSGNVYIYSLNGKTK